MAWNGSIWFNEDREFLIRQVEKGVLPECIQVAVGVFLFLRICFMCTA